MKIALAFCTLVLAFGFIPSRSHAEFGVGQNAIQVNIGFTRGGMGLGLDYEYGKTRTFGIGGYLRIYPDDTNPHADGITTIGAFIRPHFNRQNWDFYLSPGFGLISYKPVTPGLSDETLLGPSLGLGLLYEFTPQVAFGIEQMTLSSWLGKDLYRGQISQEIMVKFRFIF
jgi:hypothetical protein